MKDAIDKPDLPPERPEPPEHAIVRFMGSLMASHGAMVNRIIEQSQIASEQMAGMQKALAKQTEAHLHMIEAYEEMLSLRHQRELDAMKAEADVKLKGAIVSDLRALTPLVIKKFSGIAVNDGSGFKDLVNSISLEQFDAITSGRPVTFTDAQRELLAAALQQEAEKEDKPEAAE